MKRIIYHWTAGTSKPCADDLEHYHYIIDYLGKVHNGKFSPEDNENCNDGKYAKHTGGGNTASIGIAFCGMYVPSNTHIKNTKYPLTKLQCEKGFELGALLIKRYNLNLNDKFTIQTHYGFGQRNPKTESNGKIDIIYLPPYPSISQNSIEEFIRGKVKWYYAKI